MLTKDLIIARNDRGKLRPKFIPVEHKQCRAMATEILAAFTSGENVTRGEVEEETREMIDQWPDLRQAKGLLKIAMDLADFAPAAEMEDCLEARRQVLQTAAKMLQQGNFSSEEQYRTALADQLPENKLLQANALYADLPDNDLLQQFPDISASQLLERYNCGLVQGLLLNAEEMTLELPEINTAQLRRLMRTLKFFRLLARMEPAAAPGVRLLIDGPGSVLAQPRRYGLQLASFFPVVCNLPAWRLRAKVVWQGVPRWLELDQTSGLKGHYRRTGNYLPEEIAMFAKNFRAAATDWRLRSEPGSLRVKRDGELIFPDFVFVHHTGQQVFLELFHRWHRGQLLRRLQQIPQHPDWSLALGVDMAVAKDQEVQAELKKTTWFQKRGFLFRDYPTMEKTLKCLNGFLQE